MRHVLAGCLLAILCGCESDAGSAPISIDQVPAPVMQTAKEKLPDVNFTQALRRADGGLEVRGTDPDGKVRDVEFSADGEFLEVE